MVLQCVQANVGQVFCIGIQMSHGHGPVSGIGQFGMTPHVY